MSSFKFYYIIRIIKRRVSIDGSERLRTQAQRWEQGGGCRARGKSPPVTEVNIVRILLGYK